jgi:hypothetical protein
MKAMLFGATALALAGASFAMAQPVTPPPATTPASPPAAAPVPAAPAPVAAAPPAADTSATASGFRAGMPVKDTQGAAIGSIARVIKTPDGATTFSVTVDGKHVNLPGNALTLSPSGTEAISTMTKAQIAAATAPPA